MKWMDKLTKDFGKCAEDMPDITENIISMPSPSLNWCLGNKGIVEGKVATLFGPESGGKSLLAQLIAIETQKKYKDGIVIYFDTEYSFNKEWFIKLGGDKKRLYVRQSNDPVKIFDYIYGELLELLQDGMPVKAIIIDSIKNIKFPKDDKKISTNMIQGGSGAAYLGSVFKSVVPVIRQYGITTLLVQQVYEEMDQYKKMRNPWIVPDGRALKHASDYMLQVEKLETKDGIIESTQSTTIIGSALQTGHKVRVKCKKNRTSAPYRVAEFSLDYNSGIINIGDEIFELAKSLDVIYHPVGDNGRVNVQMWQFANKAPVRGEDNYRKLVQSDTKLQEEILEACLNADQSKIENRNTAMGMMDVSVDPDEEG